MVAARETAIGRRFAHAAEQLVAEDQPRFVAGRLAVVARDDLAIGAADAERDRLDQQRAFRCRWLGNVAQFDGIRLEGVDRDRAQGFALGSQPPEG